MVHSLMDMAVVVYILCMAVSKLVQKKLAGIERHFLKIHPKFLTTHPLEEKISKKSLIPKSIHYFSQLHGESLFAFVWFFSLTNLDVEICSFW